MNSEKEHKISEKLEKITFFCLIRILFPIFIILLSTGEICLIWSLISTSMSNQIDIKIVIESIIYIPTGIIAILFLLTIIFEDIDKKNRKTKSRNIKTSSTRR